MYEILKNNEKPLLKENLFYEGDTSVIYKANNLLYKIYLRKEKHKRSVLDYLIEHYDELKEISVPPKCKLKLEDSFGMKMNYIESIDFLSYLRQGISPEEMVRIIKILSSNLKKINNLDIHFTDLHHHNIIIDKNGYPLYIDLDDASVKQYNSAHICVMGRTLHRVSNKGYNYEDDLIKNGDLDKECLVLMLLNYIADCQMENKDYDSYYRYLVRIKKYFDNDFINLLYKLRENEESLEINKFPYYVGDFIEDDKFHEILVKVREDIKYENSCL